MYFRTPADNGSPNIECQRFINDLRRFASNGFKGNTRWKNARDNRNQRLFNNHLFPLLGQLTIAMVAKDVECLVFS